MTEQNEYAAVHLPGGNFFDDLKIDIAESHETLAKLSSEKRTARAPLAWNKLRYLANGALQKCHLQEALVMSGIRRKWFDEFHHYWGRVLSGRPLTILDFFMLAHDYRKRQQHTKELNWSSSGQHGQNWQAPSELYSTFAFVRNDALRPVIAPRFWSRLKANQSVLEYGCSLAPF